MGSGAKITEAAKEAVAIAKGEQPAARVHMNGFEYEPVDRWLPISSAPRDGTPFLAYNSFMGIYTTCFTTMWIDGDPSYEGFPCGFSDGMFGAWDCQPTQWQPLPAPPFKE